MRFPNSSFLALGGSFGLGHIRYLIFHIPIWLNFPSRVSRQAIRSLTILAFFSDMFSYISHSTFFNFSLAVSHSVWHWLECITFCNSAFNNNFSSVLSFRNLERHCAGRILIFLNDWWNVLLRVLKNLLHSVFGDLFPEKQDRNCSLLLVSSENLSSDSLFLKSNISRLVAAGALLKVKLKTAYRGLWSLSFLTQTPLDEAYLVRMCSWFHLLHSILIGHRQLNNPKWPFHFPL